MKGIQERVGRWDFAKLLKDYFDIALFSKFNTIGNVKANDKTYQHNSDFWIEALNSRLNPGQIIKLDNFLILEWIPSSPGLYHTMPAISERTQAKRRHYRNIAKQGNTEIDPELIELRPGDKRSMVNGGIGSLRLGPKQMDGRLKYVMGASSNGLSHAGIIVLLEQEDYFKVIEEINKGINPRVNLIGRLMIVPKDQSLINIEYHSDVPRFYLEVEKLSITKDSKPDEGLVSVAITFSKEEEIKASNAFSYSFCQFVPSMTNRKMEDVIDWLRNYAVKYSKSDSPIIVGDFDEYYSHFEKVRFPISEIANGMVSVENLHKFRDLFEFNINTNIMGDKNIFKKSQIGAVGSKAKAIKNNFQQLNYSIPKDLDYDKLAEELATLKDNLKSKASSADEFKAVGEIVDAENAAKNKKGKKVIKHLMNGGKWVFDTAKDIGIEVVAEIINKQME